ncbi:hypothetical protein SHELI_v1c06780 [Spiroplasma helicoides]|uniref:Nucleotidyltransferase n=1 Tax=Spiroplasma helicoides TaxID=216938 RepID=A0A1B3SL24_9MOLU|nr:hypothetical protein [Spiroplasma helicoides]AOG60629.1 hypothetical protein SHELI_v1c06780 [Spiroplasma helicoides]
MENLKALKAVLDKNESLRKKRYVDSIKVLDQFIDDNNFLFLQWNKRKPYIVRGSFAHGLDSDFTTNIDVWILLKKVSKPNDSNHNLFIYNWFEGLVKNYFSNYKVETHPNKSSINIWLENNFSISLVPFVLDSKSNITRLYKTNDGNLTLIYENDIEEESLFFKKLKKVSKKSTLANLILFIISAKIIIQSRFNQISGIAIQNYILDKYLSLGKVERSDAIKIFLASLQKGELLDYINQNYSHWEFSNEMVKQIEQLQKLAEDMLKSLEAGTTYENLVINYINNSKKLT